MWLVINRVLSLVEITVFRLENKCCKGFFKINFPPMWALEIITGHVIYNPAYKYKFQLETTKVRAKILKRVQVEQPDAVLEHRELTAKICHQVAEQFINQRDFDSAIQHYKEALVTIMYRNDELSCLFTKRFRAFCLICRKFPITSQNLCYSHSLNFHVSGST